MESFAVVDALSGASVSASVTRSALRDPDTPKPNFSSVKFETDKYCACCREAYKSKEPTLAIGVSDNTLVNGVGSLNLDRRFQREIVDNVDTGVVCNFKERRETPKTLWVRTTQDFEDDMTAHRSDLDVKSKNAVIDCRINKGCDSFASDFDTAVNTVGPLRVTKIYVDPNGRKIIVQPDLDMQGKTDEVVLTAELKGDTSSELTVRHAGYSTVLEVCHRRDNDYVIFPKIDLSTGGVVVRLNRR